MRIGIVGLGSIGQRHMRNLLEMGEQDLFAYDPRTGEEGFSCAPIQGTNSAELFWDWKPEAVLICSPPGTHYRIIANAVTHGVKRIFVEKPLAYNSEQAEALQIASKSWRATIAVGYQLRWQLDLPNTFKKDVIWECSQDMRQWLSRYEKDALLEFSHEIDAAVYVSGPVEAVTARESLNGWELQLRHLASTSMILLNHQSSDVVREAHFDDGALAWRFSGESNALAYKQELEAFLKVCRDGEWDERLCTLTQAAHVMAVIEACRESARKCKVVKL